MLTSKLETVQRFRQKLLDFKSIAIHLNENLEEWEFYESVYWITGIDGPDDEGYYTYIGYQLLFECYTGDFSLSPLLHSESDSNTYVYVYRKMLEDLIYSNVDNSEPCTLDNFKLT